MKRGDTVSLKNAKTAIITGSAGLVGSEAAMFFSKKRFNIVGIDNDMRKYFFGKDASSEWNLRKMENAISGYRHHNVDIRSVHHMEEIFSKYNKLISVIIHTAAQPSHDWAINEPITDFTVNANGTLVLLEMTRKYCPDAVFIFTSTNKVYGDTPNTLPIVELETRWELKKSNEFALHGINELMSIDNSKHSLFGASKVAADIMVQEYGKYFGQKTAVFRGGCLTGPNHSGTMLHGFLSYLMKCAITGDKYTVYGYKGKQVRDNIHSYDLVNAFYHFYKNPRCGEVYNIGGSRHSNCSILEAMALCEQISGKKMNWAYSDHNRIGDHIWYISDVRKFRGHYPKWDYKYSLEDTLLQIYDCFMKRL